MPAVKNESSKAHTAGKIQPSGRYRLAVIGLSVVRFRYRHRRSGEHHSAARGCAWAPATRLSWASGTWLTDSPRILPHRLIGELESMDVRLGKIAATRVIGMPHPA